MIHLSEKWAERLLSQPETGMGYQIATISLVDGRSFDNVAIIGGIISSVAGSKDIPFTENQIGDIVVSARKL